MNILENDINIFAKPARIIVSGASGSGKTQIVVSLIKKYRDLFSEIIISGVSSFPIEISGNIQISEDIYDPFAYPKDNPKHKLIIYDDIQSEAVKSDIISNAFTKGRHRNISIILILQNIFAQGSKSRNISLNASHFILCRSRDEAQIRLLATQIFGKEKASSFIKAYRKYVVEKKYGHLLIDLRIDIPSTLVIRTNIASESDQRAIVL